MKDIPIFTTQTGTASLILREIPYQQTAYVLVRTLFHNDASDLLSECGAFCVQAGAERVLAAWPDHPLNLPVDHEMVELSRPKAGLPRPDPAVPLTPLTRDNAPTYQTIYNRLFHRISGAASCRSEDINRLLTTGTAFLALQDGIPAGIGEIEGSDLRAVGVLPEYRGLGRHLTLTLLHRLPGPELCLSAASTNERAMRLYNSLGFRPRRTLVRWYLVTER